MTKTATVSATSDDDTRRRPHPFDAFGTAVGEMVHMLPRIWGSGARPQPQVTIEPAAVEIVWAPQLAVSEREGGLVVTATLPGVKKEDIAVTLDQGNLAIHAECKPESDLTEEDYDEMEGSFGSFDERLPLPFNVEAQQIQVSYAGGIPEITLPKSAVEDGTKAQAISIS
jgi:HSP20 family protein